MCGLPGPCCSSSILSRRVHPKHVERFVEWLSTRASTGACSFCSALLTSRGSSRDLFSLIALGHCSLLRITSTVGFTHSLAPSSLPRPAAAAAANRRQHHHFLLTT